MNESELEDIESHLYSQIYHASNDEIPQVPVPPDNSFLTQARNMKRPARYFASWGPASRAPKHMPSRQHYTKPPPVHKEGMYSKNCARPYKPDIAINQVVVLSPQSPIVCLTGKELKKAKWKAKLKDKRKRKQANRLARAQISNSSLNVENDSVIVLSDSDNDNNDDSCIIIPNNWPEISLADSDDETKLTLKDNTEELDKNKKIKQEANETLADDVILVEPVHKPPEVINVDEDSQGSMQKNSKIAKSQPPVQSLSKHESAKRLHQERKELLSTPDSACNDFVNSSGIELKERNFNFSLHGSDFNTGEFLKPASRNNETCETESSSSTTDVNVMKTAVFNEIDFPKDIFAENNLESFGQFITPVKTLSNTSNKQSTPVQKPDTSNQNQQNVYSSDSSSESDFEESQVEKHKSKKNKTLPELSPMVSKKDVIPKKAKKSGLSSKFDLIDSGSSDSAKKSAKLKKKKNKKKKTEESNKLSNTEDDVADTDVVLEEEKQKKRKSSQLEEGGEKKKVKNKKRKESATVRETEPVDSNEVAQNSSNLQETDKEVNEGIDEKTSIAVNKENFILEKKEGDKLKQKTDSTNNKEDKTVDLDDVDTNLEGFQVVDETFADPTVQIVLSSDSDSVLSPLNENPNIQLNCDEPVSAQLEDVMPSTSKTSLDLMNNSVKDIQSSMSNDPKLWSILDIDRMPITRSGKGRKCNKCREMGHMALRCPNKVVPKCSLCGETGHYEPRCPNKICTQCGKRSPYSTTYCSSCFKQRNYFCKICSMTGHFADCCPDLWRRYHITTSEGPPAAYDGPIVKLKNDLWCSGCAQSGHLEYNCRYYKPIYPPSDPYIKSYEDIYDKHGRDSRNQPKEVKEALLPTLPIPQMGTSYIPPLMNCNPFNSAFIMQGVDQRFNYNNFHKGNNFGLNNDQINALVQSGIFLTNQQTQSFFPGAPINNIQYVPAGQMHTNQNQYYFEDNLPGFISFESQPSNQNILNFEPPPPPPRHDLTLKRPTNSNKPMNKLAHYKKLNDIMFFNKPARQLQQFVKNELQRLNKLSYNGEKSWKELKKRQIPCNNEDNMDYYQLVNMVLFGIHHFYEGKKHLDKLKRFKCEPIGAHLSRQRRQQLHKSYCYIFGGDRHDEVDYDNLLRRI